MSSSGATAKLASFVVSTSFDDLPEQVVQKSTGAILDCLGVTLAGCTHQASRIVQAYVASAGGNPEARILGTGQWNSAAHAAFANGTAGHVLDFDDVSWVASGHPTVAILPATLAVCEQVGASGRDLLTAFALGFEVLCKLGKGTTPPHYQRGYHATATLGTFGATAAAGKLLGLNEEQMANALGIAASEASGLRQNFGSMTKSFHAGRANQNGVVAARLAAQGFTAAKDILEGEWGFLRVMVGEYDADTFLSGLGDPYEIVSSGIAVKRYPSCGCTLAAIDAATKLARRYGLKAAEIAAVEVGTHKQSFDVLIHHNPQTGLQGKFSMEYCVARALSDRQVLLDDFVDERVREPRVAELVKKTKLYVHPECTTYEVEKAVVSVRLKGGGTLTERVDVAKGSPSNPMSDEELLQKYEGCARVVLPPARVRETAAMILEMARLADVRQLTKALALD